MTPAPDTFKGLVHALTAGLAMTMMAYNLLEWLTRRERHLAVNVGVYGLLWCFETKQTMRHWTWPADGRRLGSPITPVGGGGGPSRVTDVSGNVLYD